jgi:hypothetical protein
MDGHGSACYNNEVPSQIRHFGQMRGFAALQYAATSGHAVW